MLENLGMLEVSESFANLFFCLPRGLYLGRLTSVMGPDTELDRLTSVLGLDLELEGTQVSAERSVMGLDEKLEGNSLVGKSLDALLSAVRAAASTLERF